MNKERWNKLFCGEGLSSKYYVDKIIDSDKLRIYMSNENDEKIIFTWDGVIESYICSEEINRNRIYNLPDVTKWSFFEIANSDYINWIVKESDGIMNSNKIHHLCIVGINSIVDVASSFYPTITKL